MDNSFFGSQAVATASHSPDPSGRAARTPLLGIVPEGRFLY